MMQGLGVLMQQTQRFIAENPVEIIFTRHTKQNDGAGGSTTDDAPLPPQTVRIVNASESQQVERQNDAGEVVRPQWRVVAMPDADLKRGDTFTHDGLNAEVVWVNDLMYELIADVAVR